MIMQAKNEEGVLVVEISGHLDFEQIQSLQDNCAQLLKKENTQQIVLNMDKLKFVGSSGIHHFIQIVSELSGSKKTKPKICKVSSEFKKMFEAYQPTRSPFEFFEEEKEAVESFKNPQLNRGIKRRKKKIV